MKQIVYLLVMAGMAGAQTPVPPAPEGSASDRKVAIEAKLYTDRNVIGELIGQDPGMGYVMVEVKFIPSKESLEEEAKITLNRDHFLLRSDKTGQTARPMEPWQIAGTSTMKINSAGGQAGTGMGEKRRVGFGIPGMGGGPQSLPGNQTPTVGSATSDTSQAQATMDGKTAEDATPATALRKALEAKTLPEGEVNGVVTGYLVFQMDGKSKVKDYELVYRKAPPRVSIRFIDPTKKK